MRFGAGFVEPGWFECSHDCQTPDYNSSHLQGTFADSGG